MQKKMFTAASSALLLMATVASGVAYASDSTQVIVKGRVIDVTCDVGVTGTPLSGILDLGSHKPSEFTAAATEVGAKTFGVGLTQCSGTADTDKNVGVTVTGSAMNGYGDYFSDNPGQSVGVSLKSGTTQVKPGDFVSSDENLDDVTTATIPFTAALIYPSFQTGKFPVVQDVQATLSFVADYQ